MIKDELELFLWQNFSHLTILLSYGFLQNLKIAIKEKT